MWAEARDLRAKQSGEVEGGEGKEEEEGRGRGGEDKEGGKGRGEGRRGEKKETLTAVSPRTAAKERMAQHKSGSTWDHLLFMRLTFYSFSKHHGVLL